MITNQQLIQEIRETNMSYLMLAQHMLHEDKEQAMFRLGLSEDAAEMISLLTPGQVLKLANNSMLMCRFRVDDDVVWGLLTSHGCGAAFDDGSNVKAVHAGILMAGKLAEAHQKVSHA